MKPIAKMTQAADATPFNTAWFYATLVIEK